MTVTNMQLDDTQTYELAEVSEDEAVIKFRKNKVFQIISLRDNTERTQYMI